MKACVLPAPAPVETSPLQRVDVPRPQPAGGEVLIRVHACGVCRTDLHVTEGELPVRKPRIIPGHQIVGVVEQHGSAAGAIALGARVGVPWLHRTCGICEFCRTGRENLCDSPQFTGWTVDGGYAEYVIAPEAFVYELPPAFPDLQAAPLLCAGIIGFRCLRLAEIGAGARLGLYGFGAAAHVAIQVARHWGADVYAATRGAKHQRLAMELGAAWAGEADAQPPAALDAAIMFAPAGELIPPALKALKKGGRLILGGIHMSPIPSFSYDLLYQERVMRSVANNTRDDGREFLKTAAAIPIRTEVEVFPMNEANAALKALKFDGVSGAAVLKL
ncbi:MAG TPA: zinc-dependent alcohol dehydrogenase family protein [Bryobacteraceae bacterium]|nr:zinc-dependent alcohol dehydrogenase family protein [Bryobacteraceae bacterium]